MIFALLPRLKFLLPKNVSAITLWPFIIFKNRECKEDTVILNHEKIHLRQQLELLVIPFYFIYLVEYFFLLVKLRNHNDAYLNISFEKEAYSNDKDAEYLTKRKPFGMWRSVRKKK